MKKRKLSAEQIDEAAELREQGWTYQRIADRLGCSAGAIEWQMLNLGAETEETATRELPQTAPGPAVVLRGGLPIRRFQPADDALLLRLRAEGTGPAEIGRALDPPRRANTVTARLMTLARHDARREAAHG